MTTDRTVRVPKETRVSNAPLSTQDVAQRGASLAFGKPPVKPKPNINTYSGNNGALAAATKVGAGWTARQHEKNTPASRLDTVGDELRLGYQNTGDSIGSSSHVGASGRSTSRQRMSRLDSSGFLQPPGQATELTKSPSFIAATLAASRSASISPNPTGQQLSAAELRRQASFTRVPPSSRRSSSRESSDHVLDTTPIPPTVSLIGLFELNAKSLEQGKRPPVNRTTKVSGRSPPPKQSKALTSARIHTPSPPPPPKPQRSSLPPKPHSASSLTTTPLISDVTPTKQLLAQAPGNAQQSDPLKPVPARKPTMNATKPLPIPIPNKALPHRAKKFDGGSSSNESFVSASDYKPSPSFRAALTNQNRHIKSVSPVSVNSFATIDSMSNGIIAASLASSRAASPSKQHSLQPPPPPPSRRSPHSHNHLFHAKNEMSRTPSPSKPSTLRTTMRKPQLEEDVHEGDKRRSKKHIMKKHPNKHHEGDRKRWRDEITERERKRYEAVWASNKGLHISPSYPGSEYSVCNLVVRDIFSRSRLHVDVLEEAYALVDRNGIGVLEKEEFVVGLWLIDQRLKGRKLPIRVSDHVWRSVGSLGRIKVRKAGK